ncbi:50S ribosomal protein L11 methyltransferase [Alkalicoccobacillus plakortidis]|uniref:Ribosomal protein L11 methyltransferase n=1 Tax=Alkalicoccobacillus plakortidis TaxID=444060 RepID=A0ABT0XPL9_9BACI|nr:50S ribosomal protein L11 methyltransferase [Alkalicoccobacillus plakortidis]MCM2677861.1 50S ribosomal protein L11 methyltransferase [Alkalicoccobacillus plakortidis]
MKWAEFSIHTTQSAVEPVCHILHQSGASGVVIEDPSDLVKDWDLEYGKIYELSPDDYPKEGVIVKAYFPVNSFLNETIEETKGEINGLVAHQIDLGKNAVTVSEVDEEDWATAWKKYYHPIKISNQITIIPTWEEYSPNEGEMIIELDPGMAFGTGTHPTTILSIQALEKTITPDDRVLDVGTGSGVLAIAAAKLSASKVDAFDLDDVAVTSARSNVELNQASSVISVKQNDLVKGVEPHSYDLVVANILAEIITSFTTDVYKILRAGGTYVTSGIIKRKKQEVKDALIEAGFEIREVTEMDDWVAITAVKPEELA